MFTAIRRASSSFFYLGKLALEASHTAASGMDYRRLCLCPRSIPYVGIHRGRTEVRCDLQTIRSSYSRGNDNNMPARRFPPPWTAEVTPNCFIVRDANGQALSYVYYESEPGRRSAALLNDLCLKPHPATSSVLD